MTNGNGRVHGEPLPLPSRTGESMAAAEATIDLHITGINLTVGGVPVGRINYVPERIVARLLAVLQGGADALARAPDHPASNKLLDLRNGGSSDGGHASGDGRPEAPKEE